MVMGGSGFVNSMFVWGRDREWDVLCMRSRIEGLLCGGFSLGLLGVIDPLAVFVYGSMLVCHGWGSVWVGNGRFWVARL